jgi:hypothetical protein
MNEKESRTKLEDKTRANAMMAVAAIAAERTWLSGHSQLVSLAMAEALMTLLPSLKDHRISSFIR